MNYNQQTATTTNYSPDGAVIGYSVKITTFAVYDLFYLISLVALLGAIIFLFLKRRK